ncbi:MAG: hypothetical protein AzoDbin1_01628 [Azoarcus sp.]|nr:hypothetical protein [Azoarcus sp.]
MNLPDFRWRTLNTRITLVTLCIFLVSIWSLALYASHILREDMQRLMGEQQFSTATILAAAVNDDLAQRLHALQVVAATLVAEAPRAPSELQTLLEQKPVLLDLFNGGVMIVDGDGTAVADVPRSTGRIGLNYMERDHIAAALREGRATVGRPVIGKKLAAPVLAMSAPIRDAQGRVVGALFGVTDLSKPNFIDKVAGNVYGRTGAYLLVAPQYRLVFAASDKSRIMETLPARGVNAAIDRFVDGYEGSAVFRATDGAEVLASAKSVPLAGWFAVVAQPIEEAFGPIRAVQQRVLAAAILLTLFAGALTWAVLRRQLAPMLNTVKTLAAFSDASHFPHPLPVVRRDEVGELIGGFNRLLETLSQRERAVRDSRVFVQGVLDSVPSQIAVLDGQGVIIAVNEPWRRFAIENGGEAGTAAPNTGVGTNYLSVCGEGERSGGEANAGIRAVLEGRSPGFSFEYPCHSPREQRWFQMTVTPLEGGHKGVVVVHSNITARKLADDRLRLAASVFTHADEGIVLTSATGRIVEVNDAFCRITGYSREEVLGRNPRIFKSGRHDDAFYAELWRQITREGSWKGEIWNRRKNGEIYPEQKTISTVRDESGLVRHYLALGSDITERKNMEDQIRRLAFYDPLTNLANRRLFHDRTRQALAGSKRTGRPGALLFIDLDNFKPLNDTHGHDIGDQLLVEVAQRLQKCVREVDTVARFGGDEFVVMLCELPSDSAESRRQAALVAQKILARLSEPYVLGIEPAAPGLRKIEHRCSASIGVTLFTGDDTNEDAVIKRADTAMYQAKEAGRGAIRVVDPDAGPSVQEAEAVG